MELVIIEDCSPYYIRFTHSDIEAFVDYAYGVYTQFMHTATQSTTHPGFSKFKVKEEYGAKVLNKTPVSKYLPLSPTYVAYFISAPKFQYGAHKDSVNNRFAINYGIRILDDQCNTRWYGEELLDYYPLNQSLIKANVAREFIGFDKNKHYPLKTLVAKQYEAVLFNTEIFHDWDNSESDNERIVLTLRESNPGKVFFEDAKRMLGFEGV